MNIKTISLALMLFISIFAGCASFNLSPDIGMPILPSQDGISQNNIEFQEAYEALKNCDLLKAKDILSKVNSLSEANKAKLVNQITLMQKNKSYFDSDLSISMRSYASVALVGFMLHKILKYNVSCEIAKLESYQMEKSSGGDNSGSISTDSLADSESGNIVLMSNAPVISSTWGELINTLSATQIAALLVAYPTLYKILEYLKLECFNSGNIKNLKDIKDLVNKIETK